MPENDEQVITKKSSSIEKRDGTKTGISKAAGMVIITIIMITIIASALIGYNFGAVQAENSSSPQYDSVASQVTSLQNQVNNLQSDLWNMKVMNQTPTTRHFVIEWAESQSSQDRFQPSFIIVNQGDTVDITFISNDTDAHTLTIGPPYNFQINASVPGTQDYLLGEKNFTTPPTNNSPGVKVFGTPGNVTGTGSFVAKYSGIYEFFCVYHVQLGMFGYLVVYPNVAYNSTSERSSSSSSSSSGPIVDIVQGAYSQNQTQNFVPSTIVIVIGVNNTVTWVNNDIAIHTVTSDSGIFDSGYLNPGQSWSYTFTNPGTYEYHCSIHPWMTGTVIVKSG
jgi:plastocyanin